MEYKLLKISTYKLEFINKIQDDAKAYELNPKFGKGLIKIDDSTYELHLAFSLHNDGKKISPYDIELEILGIFQLINGTEEEKYNFMNSNAISILFPYLRTIISTTMSSMMLSPIILPVVDARNLFN